MLFLMVARHMNLLKNMLVLINLKGTSITDYGLSLNEKLLSDGTLSPLSLLDSTTATALIVSGGVFKSYKPISELSPYQALIFQLK